MTVIKRMVIIQTMKNKISLFYGEKCMEALFYCLYIKMLHGLLRVYSFLYSFLYFCIFLKTTMEKWNKICKGT